MSPSPPVVTLLTDYGPASEYVGALHLVVVAGCPAAVRVDVAHDIPPGAIAAGARVLARCATLAPTAIHLAVVDPGVGGPRRAAAVGLADGGAVVGPDNGLLGPVVQALGAVAAVELTPPVRSSATFHGRDLFAPAAALLARGMPLQDLGVPFDPASILMPPVAQLSVGGGRIDAEVVAIDRFGNLELAARGSDLARAGWARGDRIWAAVGERRHPATIASTFSDAAPRGTLVHIDAHGHLSVAVNGGHAADRLGATMGAILTLGSW